MESNVIWSAWTSRKADDPWPRHEHSTWEMMYYDRGTVVTEIDSKPHIVHEGTVLTIPPGTTHCEVGLTDYSVYIVQIDAPISSVWPLICQDDGNRTLEHLFQSLVLEWTSAAYGHVDLVTSYAIQLGIYLTRALDSRSHADLLVAQAKRSIDKGFRNHIRIADVAREVNVCQSLLRRHFLRECGCTPIGYLKEVRRKHAVSMIKNSTMTLETVADQCGYNSASHLSRDIKDALNQTPATLRL